MNSIGQELSSARRKKGISLERVEFETKIRHKLLESMEHDDFEALPGSTYAKGFIRSYASFLGIDANSLVEFYKKNYQKTESLNIKAIPVPIDKKRRVEFNPRFAFPLAFLTLLIIIVSFLGYIGSIENVRPKKVSTFNVKKVKPKTTSKPKPVPAQKLTPRPFELTLKAINHNWIKITKNNEIIYSGYIYAGEEKKFNIENKVTVYTSSGNRLETFVNGKPNGQMSPDSEEKEKVFQNLAK